MTEKKLSSIPETPKELFYNGSRRSSEEFVKAIEWISNEISLNWYGQNRVASLIPTNKFPLTFKEDFELIQKHLYEKGWVSDLIHLTSDQGVVIVLEPVTGWREGLEDKNDE